MTLDQLRDNFPVVWLVDFEFSAPSGERPTPLCLVAREFFTGRLIRVWLDGDQSLHGCNGLPFDVGPDVLYVAFYRIGRTWVSPRDGLAYSGAGARPVL